MVCGHVKAVQRCDRQQCKREREKEKKKEKERRREGEKERRREREKERKREREKERKREREKKREGEKERRREGEKERKREGEKERRREGEEQRRREGEKERKDPNDMSSPNWSVQFSVAELLQVPTLVRKGTFPLTTTNAHTSARSLAEGPSARVSGQETRDSRLSWPPGL